MHRNGSSLPVSLVWCFLRILSKYSCEMCDLFLGDIAETLEQTCGTGDENFYARLALPLHDFGALESHPVYAGSHGCSRWDFVGNACGHD